MIFIRCLEAHRHLIVLVTLTHPLKKDALLADICHVDHFVFRLVEANLAIVQVDILITVLEVLRAVNNLILH